MFDWPFSGAVENKSIYEHSKYTSFEPFADDLITVMDEMGLKDIIFVGHSMSAMIGCIASVERPDLFKRLVLLCASPSCSSFILVELGLQKGLALVRILEIPILAFINFLPDATVWLRGGESAGAQSALMPELTFDRAVARVKRAFARYGQNPPLIAWYPVPPICGFLLSILAFHVLRSLPYAFLHPYKSEIH
ncbi:hypothetical protein PIB30_089952 [Stylosanthes scabra]|uniref:AB hydrolase-1 domain-containing protein n=1 Tax=Stylosanthes scabra TaxID=79078 RepID=A0ABU6VTY6_9FABA|nr:hypothetical protein [Stylosanthes scabra]